MRILCAASALALASASPVMAQLVVSFTEGAPKDRFSITNDAACLIAPATLTIDLSGSEGGLIFDVTGTGAGVEVFQPFEQVSGSALGEVPVVGDGDDRIDLILGKIRPGPVLAFTIDVDDTAGTRATVVSGTEIEGATVRVETGGAVYQGIFGQDAVATVPVEACTS